MTLGFEKRHCREKAETLSKDVEAGGHKAFVRGYLEHHVHGGGLGFQIYREGILEEQISGAIAR